jgi:hypothetical protein
MGRRRELADGRHFDLPPTLILPFGVCLPLIPPRSQEQNCGKVL